jgi:hypothetical protein
MKYPAHQKHFPSPKLKGPDKITMKVSNGCAYTMSFLEHLDRGNQKKMVLRIPRYHGLLSSKSAYFKRALNLCCMEQCLQAV